MVTYPNNWHTVFKMLRDRPLVFLGEKCINRFIGYINGISYAERVFKQEMPGFNWCKFEEFYKKKKKKKTKIGNSFYQCESLDAWFDLYDEFNKKDGKEDYDNWLEQTKEDKKPELSENFCLY